MNILKRIHWNPTTILILLLLLAIPIAVFLSQKRQEIRQRAAAGTVSVYLSRTTNQTPLTQLPLNTDEQIQLKLYLNASDENTINGFDVVVNPQSGMDLLTADEGTDATRFDTFLIKNIDPVTKILHFSRVVSGSSPPVINGLLHLATLTFKASAQPTTGSIQLTNIITSPSQSTPLSAPASSIAYTVAIPPTAVPNTPTPPNTPVPNTPTPIPPTPTEIPHPACNANLVQNPGFESPGNPAANWTGGSLDKFVRTQTKAHSGTTSLKSNDTSSSPTSQAIISQSFPLRASQQYSLTGFIFRTNSETTTTKRFIRAENAGTVLCPAYGPDQDATWGQVSCNFTTDASTRSVTVSLVVPSGDNTTFFDDINLTEVNPTCPTPSPGAFDTRLSLTLTLPDTQAQTKNVTVKMYDAQNTEFIGRGTVTKSSGGVYTGTIDMGTLNGGIYTIKIKADKFLQKLVGKDSGRIANTIIAGQTYAVAPTTLINGDTNNDNAVDIQDYNAIISCLGTSSQSCNRGAADLDDNGSVGPEDLNIFQRSARVAVGD